MINFRGIGPSPEDEAGHGTHVAGIIGADGDQSKMSGVAPNANLYPVKVAGSQSGGSLSNVIAGLDWVLDSQSHERIDLVNMSLGSSSLPGDGLFKKAIQKTIQNKIPIVVSAGNDRSSVQNYSPAQYEGVITVSALGSGKKQFGNFSNYGETVDMTAPGVNIPSTVPGGYGTKSGTSVSAPHVTGAAALLIGRMNERVHPRLIETGLKEMGIRRNWSGDPDSINEPMVYLQQAQILGSQLIFGDVGEDKEEDPRGTSCLIAGPDTDENWIHVVCGGFSREELGIITVYRLDSDKWKDPFTRK